MEQLGRLPTWETAQTDAITDYCFNQSTGQLEWWRRRFTPQELGGVQNSFTKTTGKTIGLSTGFRGSFAQDWDYEAALSYSRYKAKVAWPRIIDRKSGGSGKSVSARVERGGRRILKKKKLQLNDDNIK